jgi:thiol-disulfide isomerase/thioredoxin
VHKTHLSVSIILSAILFCGLNYKFKPAPDQNELEANARLMTNRIEWQGRFAPDFELRTNGGERFQLSENIGKKIIVLNFFATWCGP